MIFETKRWFVVVIQSYLINPIERCLNFIKNGFPHFIENKSIVQNFGLEPNLTKNLKILRTYLHLDILNFWLLRRSNYTLNIIIIKYFDLEVLSAF